MNEIVEEIPPAMGGQRIDRIVSMSTGLSRSASVQLIVSGGVTVNGNVPQKPSERVNAGATVVMVVAPTVDKLQPDPSVDVRVVFEDDDVVVVDKPAGVVVHPGAGIDSGTLIQGLLVRFPELLQLSRDASMGDAERPGIVHRLDKGTSGVMMVARNPKAYESLVAQLASRTVVRRYLAVVHGDVESASGVIDAPLGRSPKEPTRRAVIATGRPARTHYEVEARYRDPYKASLVKLRLETGRTHQIRAHFAAIDHPVVGDDRYGGSDLGLELTRPFLHAAILGFIHPTSGEQVQFESPLPDDLTAALVKCRSSLDDSSVE